MSRAVPGGRPIPGVTNLGDVEWALTKARRFIFEGGDSTDPRYRDYVDRWLDYRNEIAGSSLERVGVTRELVPSPLSGGAE